MTRFLSVFLLMISTTLFAAQPEIRINTSLGSITLELYADKAPKTVENFLSYVNEGFYNGTIFHRVIANFMIQGGGFDQSLIQKPTKQPIENEAANGLRNEIGTIAMARTGDPHSATAQFFINVANNSFLNHTAQTIQGYGYTVFGKVTKGMDVVNKIAATPTGPKGIFASDVPKNMIVIESIELLATPSDH
ncbi:MULTISPECIES: peptidylprolyl isomerase [unclassified Nitrosomonas]|uniref:peptidylprolyl isomerase n=1 Tax=unclassified Nitrosomonas TaxID=2609265 RepID=UPI0008906B36|nr:MULTISPECIES: peptidylprolyl isomerase [unclassified Nitrosomonas]SDG98425.1 peptidyl-prolyl cis-trans isomerase A (cyclophilin A)/peptidyl-prolyl cis-trans isomerase B (cyclophilin B) [Nitrosomonas sp. Nm132]SDY49421.1 peptidyl-prolyl cis-trans isomerase A (cyclophilin A)/peptidyl-prolyl cis-trans isomerase B (cyclophilin B) [Nitrosomonas sp. Nm58]